jgi:Na+-transporting methylmalonyl-CoA/oxaloacetate decarboxylase gamma subunit
VYFYFFTIQPSNNPAFTNTIYQPEALQALRSNTPTSLIQTYYSCVLAPWPALIDAVGVGSASAQFFVFIGFLVYLILLVNMLNTVARADIPSKRKMEKMDAKEAAERDEKIDLMLKLVEAIQADAASGTVVRYK